MEEKDVRFYQSKHVKIFLKNGNIYTCKIKDVSGSSVKFIDKFGMHITVSLSEIGSIVEISSGVKDG